MVNLIVQKTVRWLIVSLRTRVIVVCVGLTQAHTFGINSVSPGLATVSSRIAAADSFPQIFGVFLAYYLDNEIIKGATPLQFSFVGGLSYAVGIYCLCRDMGEWLT